MLFMYFSKAKNQWCCMQDFLSSYLLHYPQTCWGSQIDLCTKFSYRAENKNLFTCKNKKMDKQRKIEATYRYEISVSEQVQHCWYSISEAHRHNIWKLTVLMANLLAITANQQSNKPLIHYILQNLILFFTDQNNSS